jgi:hypothetical protein
MVFEHEVLHRVGRVWCDGEEGPNNPLYARFSGCSLKQEKEESKRSWLGRGVDTVLFSRCDSRGPLAASPSVAEGGGEELTVAQDCV